MNEHVKDLKVSVVCLFIGFLVMTFVALKFDFRNIVPECPEDAVLMGVGDFKHGRWTGYECGPSRDSYLTEEAVAKYICENPAEWYVESSACVDF